MKKIAIVLVSLLMIGCSNDEVNTNEIFEVDLGDPMENIEVVELNEEDNDVEVGTLPAVETIPNTVIEVMTTEDVLWLQESLKIAGHYVARDGDFGPKTQGALEDFQLEKGFDTIGYTTETKAALEEIREAIIAPNYKTDKVLLNKQYYLPADFVPENLREVNVDKNKYMELPDHVATVVETMFEDAKKDGIYIVLASAYRSYDYQEGIFSRQVARNGFEEAEKVVAIPGESEHQTGLAIDISTQAMGFGLGQSFENDPAFDWMMANGHKYGFILRYLKGREDETGYIYEPWHYRYLGDVEMATYIMENGLILEEYSE